MSNWSLIIYGLIALLIIISLAGFGTADREWLACKESMIQQFFGSNCTPINGIGVPADPNAPSLSSPGSNV
ncbi:MAG: hypothetical protein ACPGYQ_02935 [Candidatus Puniceispirillales bacterium]